MQFPPVTKALFPILASVICAFSTIWVGAAEPNVETRRHVVLVVWDGMRPDFVSEQNTPTLWKLARSGVTFRNHHSVYLSATNVNGVALATGDYPDHSDLIANREFRPKIDNRKPIDVDDPAMVRKADDLSNEKYLATPTLSEILRANGKKTAVAAAKRVGLLHDRHRESGHSGGVTIFEGNSIPPDAVATIAKTLGQFPPLEKNEFAKSDAWTTRALTDFLWKDGVPDFSVLWLSEPDATQHQTAPGAPAALAAIKSSDANLDLVLATLNRYHALKTTDIFVVSDHGFSTIEHAIDLRKKAAGFDVVTEFADGPKPGQIMIVGVGGSVLFYVSQHDGVMTRRLVEFLQQTDFAGPIFAKQSIEGTFTLEQAKIDSADAADVVMSFRWNENKNQFGVSGMIDGDWQRAAGKGTHATLSRFDMHNTLIAAGPDFQKGLTSDLPSGNVDLAPTILQILRITNAPRMDGRVLSEAMTRVDKQELKPETETKESVKKFSSGTWRQNLKMSRVGSTIYLDEGNGAFLPNEPGN
jgi:predicted AlkP superfamily pyrophosphatase or phosphodiesterase